MIIRGIREAEKAILEIVSRGKTVLAFVGSPLRSDDRAGLLVYEKLRFIKNREQDIVMLQCEFGLENCITDIMRVNPEYLVIVDSIVAEGLKPGEVILASKEHIRRRFNIVTTHSIPIDISLELLLKNTNIKKIYILGIQVKDTSLSLDITGDVEKAVDELVRTLTRILIHAEKPQE